MRGPLGKWLDWALQGGSETREGGKDIRHETNTQKERAGRSQVSYFSRTQSACGRMERGNHIG